MKQRIIYVCVLLVSMAMFSCSQDEEVYSCDKEVDTWVKENLDDIRHMDRSKWLELDERVSRAVYIAFAPEQKQIFWQQKIQEVLSLNWNESEKEHIVAFYETVKSNPDWFDLDTSIREKCFEDFELFKYRWTEYAKEELGWTLSQIASIAYTGNKMIDESGKIQFKNNGLRLKSDSEVDCDCNWTTNICGLYYQACGRNGQGGVNCREKSPGCGFLLRDECNGLCTR